jgi:vacuolar-type H+-ATPase subunit D/Vma8
MISKAATIALYAERFVELTKTASHNLQKTFHQIIPVNEMNREELQEEYDDLYKRLNGLSEEEQARFRLVAGKLAKLNIRKRLSEQL